MKQYTLSQTYGLRFVIILLPAALLKRFPCKSCAMYAASRSKAIRKLSQRRCTLQVPRRHCRESNKTRQSTKKSLKFHFRRSLPSGFRTQILYTRWTLFSNLSFCLAFNFRRFSFFLLPLLMWSLCRPLKMLRKLSLLSSSVSVSRITFSTFYTSRPRSADR